jgi:hypothetical protein
VLYPPAETLPIVPIVPVPFEKYEELKDPVYSPATFEKLPWTKRFPETVTFETRLELI